MNDEHVNKKFASTTRRSFLKKLWGVFGVIAGLELIAVSAGFMVPGKRNTKSSSMNLITAGKVNDFKLNSVFPFRSGKFYLVRLSDGGFLAVSLKCSHLGCSVLWNEENQRFNCPCHASSFDLVGNVINPPAPRPLDTFPVTIEEGQVKVDVGRPVKRLAFESSQVTYA
ncbi:MAG: Rieske (2Fe-2S) protein [Bacteroidales bacterium]